MVKYTCQACMKGRESPDSMAGGIERCPNCGAEVRIPPLSTPITAREWCFVGGAIATAGAVIMGCFVVAEQAGAIQPFGGWVWLVVSSLWAIALISWAVALGRGKRG